jgi:hypothetical protein
VKEVEKGAGDIVVPGEGELFIFLCDFLLSVSNSYCLV